ncbi:MAG: pyridoxal phosphate-dependent aminotransferase [Gemmatimonadales bacterium]
MTLARKPASSTFRPVPYMGVIWVVHEAHKRGFWNGHPDWCNLGQGQPEVGPMEGAPERLSSVRLEPGDHAYGPIGGTDELREVIAAHYNRLYRLGKSSQYTKDNVSVAAGGRLVLSRVVATLGKINLGYQIPDYTAYEDMLNYHSYRVNPVLIETTAATRFMTPSGELARRIDEHDLSAYLISNPCNPTGQVVSGEELEAYVRIGRERDCTLLMDEFYSHFIYTEDGQPGGGPVSTAEYVDDVNSDPVVIVDGLTKSFRYPGWRLGWAVGPPEAIEMINRAASAIDGGPSQIVQRLALQVLEPDRADQETTALRNVFARKRNLMVDGLRALGMPVDNPSTSTFYVWASIADLPEPLNDAESLFFKAIEKQVMTVPGYFFDVNPDKQRPPAASYRQWVRFSFGPPEGNVGMGLERLADLVAEHA